MINMETIIAAVVSFFIGGGAVFLFTDTDENVAERQLTNTDLAESACSPNYIERHGESLCRELFCRMSSNKTDGKTGAKECEEISNIINSREIWRHCMTVVDDEKQEKCFRLYEKRK